MKVPGNSSLVEENLGSLLGNVQAPTSTHNEVQPQALNKGEIHLAERLGNLQAYTSPRTNWGRLKAKVAGSPSGQARDACKTWQHLGRAWNRTVSSIASSSETQRVQAEDGRLQAIVNAANRGNPLERGSLDALSNADKKLYKQLGGREWREIQVDDATLVRGLGLAPTDANKIVSKDSLFSGGSPKLSDIKQADSRDDAYLLSTLASILANPDGAARIQNMIRDHGDGTATVRFADMDVTVSTSRLVDKDGYDLTSGGANWVRVVEKAFLARQMRLQADATNGSKAAIAGEPLPREAAASFDSNSAVAAQKALRHAIAGKTVLQTARDIDPHRARLSGNGFRDAAKQALASNAAVTFTSKSGAKSLFSRLASNHVYSVLGVASRNGERGFLLFDPVGQRLDERDFGEYGNENQLTGLKRGRTPVFFVSLEDARKYFHDEVQVYSPTQTMEEAGKTIDAEVNQLPQQLAASFLSALAKRTEDAETNEGLLRSGLIGARDKVVWPLFTKRNEVLAYQGQPLLDWATWKGEEIAKGLAAMEPAQRQAYFQGLSFYEASKLRRDSAGVKQVHQEIGANLSKRLATANAQGAQAVRDFQAGIGFQDLVEAMNVDPAVAKEFVSHLDAEALINLHASMEGDAVAIIREVATRRADDLAQSLRQFHDQGDAPGSFAVDSVKQLHTAAEEFRRLQKLSSKFGLKLPADADAWKARLAARFAGVEQGAKAGDLRALPITPETMTMLEQVGSIAKILEPENESKKVSDDQKKALPPLIGEPEKVFPPLVNELQKTLTQLSTFEAYRDAVVAGDKLNMMRTGFALVGEMADLTAKQMALKGESGPDEGAASNETLLKTALSNLGDGDFKKLQASIRGPAFAELANGVIELSLKNQWRQDLRSLAAFFKVSKRAVDEVAVERKLQDHTGPAEPKPSIARNLGPEVVKHLRETEGLSIVGNRVVDVSKAADAPASVPRDFTAARRNAVKGYLDAAGDGRLTFDEDGNMRSVEIPGILWRGSPYPESVREDLGIFIGRIAADLDMPELTNELWRLYGADPPPLTRDTLLEIVSMAELRSGAGAARYHQRRLAVTVDPESDRVRMWVGGPGQANLGPENFFLPLAGNNVEAVPGGRPMTVVFGLNEKAMQAGKATATEKLRAAGGDLFVSEAPQNSNDPEIVRKYCAQLVNATHKLERARAEMRQHADDLSVENPALGEWRATLAKDATSPEILAERVRDIARRAETNETEFVNLACLWSLADTIEQYGDMQAPGHAQLTKMGMELLRVLGDIKADRESTLATKIGTGAQVDPKIDRERNRKDVVQDLAEAFLIGDEIFQRIERQMGVAASPAASRQPIPAIVNPLPPPNSTTATVPPPSGANPGFGGMDDNVLNYQMMSEEDALRSALEASTKLGDPSTDVINRLKAKTSVVGSNRQDSQTQRVANASPDKLVPGAPAYREMQDRHRCAVHAINQCLGSEVVKDADIQLFHLSHLPKHALAVYAGLDPDDNAIGAAREKILSQISKNDDDQFVRRLPPHSMADLASSLLAQMSQEDVMALQQNLQIKPDDLNLEVLMGLEDKGERRDALFNALAEARQQRDRDVDPLAVDAGISPGFQVLQQVADAAYRRLQEVNPDAIVKAGESFGGDLNAALYAESRNLDELTAAALRQRSDVGWGVDEADDILTKLASGPNGNQLAGLLDREVLGAQSNYAAIEKRVGELAQNPDVDRFILCVPNHYVTFRRDTENRWHLLDSRLEDEYLVDPVVYMKIWRAMELEQGAPAVNQWGLIAPRTGAFH
jgi:hypothetical protein